MEKNKSTFVCEKCGALAYPKNHVLLSAIYGSLLGVLYGVLGYWVFTRYFFDQSPAFSLFLVTPIVIVFSVGLFLPYSKWLFKWVAK